VKFRTIDPAVLERLQIRSDDECRIQKESTEDGTAPVIEDGDEDDDDDDGSEQAAPVGTAGAGSTLSINFKVNPHIDLKSAALRDMISREPIVSEQTIAPVQNPSQPGQGGHILTVDEAFAEW